MIRLIKAGLGCILVAAYRMLGKICAWFRRVDYRTADFRLGVFPPYRITGFRIIRKDYEINKAIDHWGKVYYVAETALYWVLVKEPEEGQELNIENNLLIRKPKEIQT